MIKKLVYISVVLMTVIGCSDRNFVGDESTKELSFAAKAEQPQQGQIASKAGNQMVTGNQILQQQSFGVYGYMSASIGGEEENVFSTSTSVEVGFSEGKWIYSPAEKWKTNNYYRFRAFWPYDAAINASTSNADLIEVDYDITVHDYDLMVAQATRHPATEGYGIVPLHFKHTLSALRFYVSFSQPDLTGTMTEFSLSGLAQEGKLTYSGSVPELAQWASVPVSNTQQYLSEENVGITDEDVNINGEGATLFAIPQTIEAEQVAVSIRIGSAEPQNVYIPAVQWKPGMIYNYYFSITPTLLEVEVSSEPWIEKVSVVVIDI